LIQEAKKQGYTEVYLPKENAEEAALVDGIKIFGANNLAEVVEHLSPTEPSKISSGPRSGARPAQKSSSLSEVGIKVQPKTEIKYENKNYGADFAEVRGQEGAKRGLEIAAAGGHNIAMYGPPGTGKTMLARAFSQLLPDLSLEEVLESQEFIRWLGQREGNLFPLRPSVLRTTLLHMSHL